MKPASQRASAAPKITGVLETSIYSEDVERSARFYEELFGFHRMASDNRFCAFDVAGRSVLLIFLSGGMRQPIALPGGVIPPHDGRGNAHFAFAVPAQDLASWEERLAEAGVAMESRVRWEHGGQSIYFRDPDQNLVELATPGTWPMY